MTTPTAKITCNSTDCRNHLHCFKPAPHLRQANQIGACRRCGADLVDWQRVHRRDLSDSTYTIEALKLELIRHKFWHVEIDAKAINHAKRNGIEGMRAAARSRIRKSVGAAEPVYDGRQTPMEGCGNAGGVWNIGMGFGGGGS